MPLANVKNETGQKVNMALSDILVFTLGLESAMIDYLGLKHPPFVKPAF